MDTDLLDRWVQDPTGRTLAEFAAAELTRLRRRPTPAGDCDRCPGAHRGDPHTCRRCGRRIEDRRQPA